MTDRNEPETENERQFGTLCYFFRHKIFKYIFLVVDDQRILEDLIENVRVQLEQNGKRIIKFSLSEDDHYVYRQVKNFLESDKQEACDGLIVTGLNALIYRHKAESIELLNTSRDAFSRFRLPIVFVVNLEILRRIIKGAPDLYNMRDLPDLQFEGTLAPDMDILASSSGDYSKHELTNIELKIQLLENQLKRTKIKGKIDADQLNNMIIPLLILYMEQGNLKKMKSIYRQYIKGNENRIKDMDTLERFRRKTAEPAQFIGSDGKYIDDRIETRRRFIREGEWNKAAEITFELEDYLTLHGFSQRLMELLREFEGKPLNDKNRAAVYHQMGILYQGFGDYDAALAQYRQSLEIREKIEDIKGQAESLHEIGNVNYLKKDYSSALAQYRQSLEIARKIGDNFGVAISLGQIGKLYHEQKQYETALKYLSQAFLFFSEIGSHYANQVKNDIALVREKMPKERFNEILKEFSLVEDAEFLLG